MANEQCEPDSFPSVYGFPGYGERAMAESLGAVNATIMANGGIKVTEFAAAAISGPSAMISEGIHSVVDTGNQAFMLLGLKRAQKPADEDHP